MVKPQVIKTGKALCFSINPYLSECDETKRICSSNLYNTIIHHMNMKQEKLLKLLPTSKYKINV